MSGNLQHLAHHSSYSAIPGFQSLLGFFFFGFLKLYL